MQDLLLFLKANETWIYLFLGVLAILMIRKLVIAWLELRKSIFGLEREAALRRISYAATMTSLVLLIILAQFILVTFIAPLNPVNTDLNTLESTELTITGENSVEEPAATDESGTSPIMASALNGEGCIKEILEWTYPEAGTSISGLVELRGTINYANLGFYKYEYRSIGSEAWTTIAAGDSKKVDEPVGGTWNTEQLLPGDYELRLVASDNENSPFPACVIPITIVITE